MAYPLRFATAGQEIPLGAFVLATDGNTEANALTIANTDIKLHKHGATALANKNSGGATTIGNAYYYAVLDATDTNTLGGLVISVHIATTLLVRLECLVYSAEFFDAMFGTEWLGVDAYKPKMSLSVAPGFLRRWKPDGTTALTDIPVGTNAGALPIVSSG